MLNNLIIFIALIGLEISFVKIFSYKNIIKKQIPTLKKEKEIIKRYYLKDEFEVKLEKYERESFIYMLSILIFIPFIGLFATNFIVFYIMLGFYLYFYRILKMSKIIVKRRNSFLEIYPDLIDYLNINMAIGLPLIKILKKYIELKSYKDIWYLKVIGKNIDMYHANIAEKEIYQNIIDDLHDREVIIIVNFFNLYNTVGLEAKSYLKVLSKEAAIKKYEMLKKKGEEASVKLLLPTSLIFVSILLLVMAPSLLLFNN